MSKRYDFRWAQGEDLNMTLTYSRKDESSSQFIVVDLTGQSARMDIRDEKNVLVAVFNSDDITDTDPETPGSQGDSQKEITLDVQGRIIVAGNRDYLLPGGTMYAKLNPLPNRFTEFYYDLVRRGTAGDQQQMIYGKIVVERSATLWT